MKYLYSRNLIVRILASLIFLLAAVGGSVAVNALVNPPATPGTVAPER